MRCVLGRARGRGRQSVNACTITLGGDGGVWAAQATALCVRGPSPPASPAVALPCRRFAVPAAPPKPLEGIRVLELASVLAGPTVGQFLGELGADVLKVENMSTRGDVTRSWRLPQEGDGTVTAYFSSCNLGKRSVAIDARKKEGVALLRDLARRSDVVLASYKPGDAAKFGLDAASLRSLNPRLIYAELTGYGSDDSRVGYDAVIQAEAGFMYMNGEPGGSPCKMPVALIDLLAAHQLKEAILVELLRRERTGEGGHVTTSLFSSAVASLANQATAFLKAGVIAQRLGSEHPSICPYGLVVACSDGLPLVLAVGADAQFRQLCEMLGCAELAADERFATNRNRVLNRQATNAVLREKIATAGPRQAVLDECSRRKIPAGAVNDMAAVFAQPKAEELVVRGPEGEFYGTREVMWTSGGNHTDTSSATVVPRPPPEYAAHTKEVLQEVLDLDDAAIAALAEQGAIQV